ncbi:MAG: response regulator, partial [Catalinimonas sp.]
SEVSTVTYTLNTQKAFQILLVEDDPVLRMTTEMMLENLGYEQVAQAHSGEDAVAWARDHRPDLILMDIYLPGRIDGIEAAEQIRRFSNVPIVFTTGDTTANVQAQLNGMTNAQVARKPVRPHQLKDILDAVDS